MTTCVAAICDDGNAIVLVADKMIGFGYVESELEITKMRQLHKDWWILFAGEPFAPVFDIIDYAKARIDQQQPATVSEVQDAIKAAFAQKRIDDAETLFLSPIGWDITRFNDEGHQKLPDFEQIKAQIQGHILNVQLLVAGFDSGKGHIFTLLGYGEKRGIPSRSDIPGFDAIGSGSTGAMYMMFYRNLSPKTGVREALYYALEGKYFGEQATGVGASTDLFVARHGKEIIQLNDEETIEEKLIPICYAMSPNLLRKRDFDTLNNLAELIDFPEAKKPEKIKKPKPQKDTSRPTVSTSSGVP